MAPSPPPTGLLSGALPTRHVTEDTPPDMLAGSMDLRVTLPSGHTVKMSVERSTPMMDLLVNITTAHKVSPGGHVLQAMGERGVLPYKPSTPIGALDTWSLRVVPRHQVASQQPSAKRAPPKPLALQSSQPFEQTFRLQVRLPRNQLFVARLSPRTALADILVHVCREKNLDPAKYELRHPVNTDQPLQLSLSLADYRVTEVALVPRGSRAPTELSSSDIPALQTHEPATVPGDSRHQRASNAGSSSSTGSFGAMLKRTRSGGTTEGSLSGDSLGGRSSSPTRSDESLGRSVSPPAPRPPLPAAPQQPPPPPRHRKGRAPKPPPPQPTSSGASTARSAPPDAAVTDERCTLVISHSRNSSDSSGYHEASVLSESPENHTNHGRPIDSPPGTLARGKGSKAAKAQHKQFSRSMSNLSSEASTSTVEQSSTQNLSSAYSMSTTSLAKKKRAPAPPAPPAREMKEEPATLDMLASSSDVLEQARPNPKPRTRISLAPARPSSHHNEKKSEPPPVTPRLAKTSSSIELFKKSSISRGLLGLVKKSEKKNKSSSIGSGAGSLIKRRRPSKQSSVGSSSSSVFGVGKSLLAMGSSQDLPSESDDPDDLDLDLFEGGIDSDTDTLQNEEEDDTAFENFHSILRTKKRNSITQIINKTKAPAPKAPKPVGYRVRPKLQDISWSTTDDNNEDNEETERQVSSALTTQDNFSFEFSRSNCVNPDESMERSLRRWSNSSVLHDGVSGDGTNSDQESTDEERTTLSNGHPRDDEEESVGEDDLDSAFQSVTDVLEEQLRTEALREEDRLAREAYEERLTEEKKRLAAEERMRNEEWLRSEEERKEAEEQRRIIEEERARLVEEREELARQRREQKILEQQLRERLQQELEEKQRAIQLEQRREIERLQREQEELERELREREKEKADRMKQKEARKQRSNQAFFTEQVISDIPDWEYKLPAPPSAFRDKQADVIELTDNLENKDRRNSLESTNSEENADVESKNKLNAMTKDENYSDSESRPPPPAVVEVRVKSPAVGSPPPRVSVQPLRSAQSLYSLSQEDESATCDAPPVVLRKTSSVADVSSMDDDSEALRLQQLQQQFLQWQEQLLSNQSVLQGHVSMPLQSLQVLREILPQMKQKMGEDVTNEGSLNLRSSTLPRTVRTSEVSMEPPSVSTLDRRPAVVTSQRYCPPTVNLGTWSERPKSEVSLKQDSDYRIGVGQHQYTAARAPVVRSAEPKLKDTTNLISGGAVNREVVVRSNSWRTPSVAPHKPSLVVIQSMNASTEQVRASNKPTVILRHEPMSLIDIPPPQRRYTTLVGINGAPQPTAKNNGFQNQQRNITQATNPVVKGFKLDLEPPPPPPPPVIRNLTQKRVPLKSNNADPRDELMDAIRGFGGRSNLRKTRSMQL